MIKNSPIPFWVNLFLLVIVFFMAIQVYWFYFDHQFLQEAGIAVDGAQNLNILFTTAGRLVAMIAATVFVLITQNPNQYLVVLLMCIFREGQEMFIDPLFPYANSPTSPMTDLIMHIIIVTLEVTAFVVVFRKATSAAAKAK